MREEVEFLKKRGREFWERGFEDLQKERYNLSVLDFEQAIQLWFKYLIALKAGDFPKTHFIIELMEEVIEIYGAKKLKDFYMSNQLSIKEIEDAYITSRYYPREFTKEETEAVIELSLKIVKILEDETNHKFI